MSRKIRVRTSPGASLFGAVFGGIFVLIGLLVAIPTFGAFGVLWTFAAMGITGFHLYNAFSKRGVANNLIEIGDDEDVSTLADGRRGDSGRGSVEARLRTLEDLRAKALITAAEYERRRQEIVNQI